MSDAVWDDRAPHRSRPPAPAQVPTPGAVRVITVAPASEGPFHPRMYSYWSNAFVRGDTVYVFAGHVDGRARFFEVTLTDRAVRALGPLLGYAGTSEGWYWDARGWLYIIEGPRLRHVNPFTGEDRVVFEYVSQLWTRLWQAHSSDDGQVHSATVQRVVGDAEYQRIGTAVYYRGTHHYYEAVGALDESQVDRSGEYVIVKEGDANRIITLATGEERLITNAEGALGHSDCGNGFMVGEDDTSDTWQMVLWDLATLTKRVLLRGGSEWGSGMGYVSVRGGRILHSGATTLELVQLFDEGGSTTTHLLTHGGGTSYDDRVKANLSPCGRVATFMVDGAVQLLVLP